MLLLQVILLLICGSFASCSQEKTDDNHAPQGEPPLTFDFQSWTDLEEFVAIANEDPEVYRAFYEEKDDSHSYFRSYQDYAIPAVANILKVSYPKTINGNKIELYAISEYRVDTPSLSILFQSNDILYDFLYCFNYDTLPSIDKEVILTDTMVGEHVVDWYAWEEEPSNDRYYGFYMDGNIRVRIDAFNVKNIEDIQLESLTFAPLLETEAE